MENSLASEMAANSKTSPTRSKHAFSSTTVPHQSPFASKSPNRCKPGSSLEAKAGVVMDFRDSWKWAVQVQKYSVPGEDGSMVGIVGRFSSPAPAKTPRYGVFRP